MKRLEFVKSIFAIPLFVNIKKENTIEEYLIEKGFIDRNKDVRDLKYYLKDKIYIVYNKNINQLRVTKYKNAEIELIKSQFFGKIENVTELKQLFKFLEI